MKKIRIPNQFVIHLEELAIAQQKIDQFVQDITKKIQETCDNNPRIFPEIQLKRCHESDDECMYIYYRDKLVALVFQRRTEFNHAEFTFFVYYPTFGHIAKWYRELQGFYKGYKAGH